MPRFYRQGQSHTPCALRTLETVDRGKGRYSVRYLCQHFHFHLLEFLGCAIHQGCDRDIVRRMTSEHLPTFAEVATDPERFRKIYTEQLEAAQNSAHEARYVLRKVEIAERESMDMDDSRVNGAPKPKPKQRTAHPADDVEDEQEPVPVTRKPQVRDLLRQTPGQEWSVRQISEALRIENQKSLRVTLDEMARAGTLTKTPDARYLFEEEGQTTIA